MKKNFLIILSLFLINLALNAQDIVLEEDVKSDTIIDKWGKNRSNFQHFYLDLNFSVPVEEEKGAEVRYGFSHGVAIGYRYKKRLSNIFAIGLDGSYHFFKYDIKQNHKKIIPNIFNKEYDKEKYKTHSLSAEGFFRINIGRRGNFVGNFLDIGYYGSWIFGFNHWYKYEYKKTIKGKSENNCETIISTEKNLNYVENLEYGLRVRMGLNRYILSASYRMSDLFNSQTDFEIPELPVLKIGLQIGFY